MRSPLAKLRPFLTKATLEARERYASGALARDKVRALMTEAADAGRSAVRVALTMNVRGTKAALTLETWAEEEGFILTWEDRSVDRPDRPRETIFEPELRWIEAGIR